MFKIYSKGIIVLILALVTINTPMVIGKAYIQNNLSKIYENTLFIGDSQTIAISQYKFLPSQNVAAKKGLSLTAAIKYKDITNKLKDLKPKNIFILFGHNDIYKSTTPEGFIKSYKTFITFVKSNSPKSKIFIESVTPISNSAENRYPGISNMLIYQCNISLKSMAASNNLNFINISGLITNSNYLEPDGIHLRSNFYPVLLNYLAKNVK
jgi:lysophospholipase L1-like esterase